MKNKKRVSHPTKSKSLLDFPTLEESKLISPLVKKMSRNDWRQPTKAKLRKSKGLTGTVLVVVAAICVQRYARGYLKRKKCQSRKVSFHAAGVAKSAAVCASKIVSNLQVHFKIIEASNIASCASKHAVQQALLARSCCDDVMKRREQDQAALLSAVAAFAASVASRSAMKISEEASLEISKLKQKKKVQEQEKKKKKKKGKKKKNERKHHKKQEEEKNIDDVKSLPFLPTSVQYWSPIQKVSSQKGIPDSMIVRAQHQNNSQKEETTRSRRSLSPPRRMKIECDEISQRILSPVVMNKERSNLNNNMKEKKRKASKLIDKFENIQNDHSESDLTRGEEPKRLVLETHQVDVLTPSSCADIKIEEEEPKEEEEVSSETPQKSLRRLRHRQNNNGPDQQGGENSCACACVVM